MSLTLRQLEGFQHAPNRTVKRLALTAIALTERCEELARKLREVEEQRASEQLERDGRLLVVLHRDGYVEVYSSAWQPVVIANMPSLGPGSEEEAEGYMLKRLPLPYRQLYSEGKRILAGSCAGCMDRTAYRLLKHELAALEGLKALNANWEETPDAAKAKAQPMTVSSESPEQAQPVVVERN
jgi:hypothetical protein